MRPRSLVEKRESKDGHTRPREDNRLSEPGASVSVIYLYTKDEGGRDLLC